MICRMNLIYCEFANSNGYCERTACCNPNIVGNTIKYEEQKAFSQQYVDELKAKYAWHTGTPTEEGDYLVKDTTGHYKTLVFVRGQWLIACFDDWHEFPTSDVLKWQKIEDKETE